MRMNVITGSLLNKSIEFNISQESQCFAFEFRLTLFLLKRLFLLYTLNINNSINLNEKNRTFYLILLNPSLQNF